MMHRLQNGNKVVSHLDFSTAANMLGSVHNDGAVRLWDPRVGSKCLRASLIMCLIEHTLSGVHVYDMLLQRKRPLSWCYDLTRVGLPA